MKFVLILALTLSSSFVFAAEKSSNILSAPTEDCLTGESKNVVIYERLKKLENGTYWVNNIHLKSGKSFVRIKDSEKNRKRICKELGFNFASAGLVEFDKGETVVGINSNLEVKSLKKPESKYILNLNCF
jgi:hypothetical protein